MAWEIEYYKTASGREIVKDFIGGLGATTNAKLGRKLDLLEEYGYRLGMPYVKPFGDGLLELRVRGTQEVRIFYLFIKSNKIYLLHGFIKHGQATPRKELATARLRQKEIHLTIM